MEPEDGLEKVQEVLAECSEEMTDAQYKDFLEQVIDECQTRLDVL